MTLIGATHKQGNWEVFADDGLSMGRQTVNSSKYYRKKFQFLPRTNEPFLAVSTGYCDEIDFALQQIDKKLCTKNLDGEYTVLDIVSDAMFDIRKDLKELKDNPGEYLFFLLDVNRDTLYRVCELGAIIIPEESDVVEGSGSTAFYELGEDRDFIDRFLTACEADEYCRLPVFWFNGEKCTKIEDRVSTSSFIDNESGKPFDFDNLNNKEYVEDYLKDKKDSDE